MIVQKSEWLAWPPALLRTAACLSAGSVSSFVSTSSTRRVGEVGALERLVGVVDVGLMVLAVVDLHRARVDRRLERVVGVGKVGK